MSNSVAEGQAANIIPPRTGKVIATTLDNTSRAKNLGAMADLAGVTLEQGGVFYLTLRCSVRWYYRLGPATGTVDETAADAAATGTPTYVANACMEAAADEPVHIRVDRVADLFLIVKGSAAGVLRWYVSSEVSSRRG